MGTSPPQPELSAREIDQLFADIKEIKLALKEITGIHAKEMAELQALHLKEIADLQKQIGDLRVELATMKVKIGVIASISSLIGGGIITLVVSYWKDGQK